MKVTRVNPEYILLKPVDVEPIKDVRIYDQPLSVSAIEKYILGPASKGLCAVDLETRGLSPFYPHHYKEETYDPKIMGVGFGWRTLRGEYKAAYVDLGRQPTSVLKYMCERLTVMPIIGHNVMFDGVWLRNLALSLGVTDRLNWVGDTFGYLKQLAPSDFLGQRHGLKAAQIDLLGWDAKGDVDLDAWLIDAGFSKMVKSKGMDTAEPRAIKSEMWRAPARILGHYCGLDCVSTLQLYDYVFHPVVQRFPMLVDYHEEGFMETIQHLIDQRIDGTVVDFTALEEAYTSSMVEYQKNIDKFFELEEIQPFLLEFREKKIAEVKKPKQFKKNGEVSKVWLNYEAKIAKMREDPRYLFNPGSDKDLRWLFYEKLYKAEKEITVYNGRERICYKVQSPRGEVVLPATDSGGLPIDKKARPWLGEAGILLSKAIKPETTISTFIGPYKKFATESFSKKMHPNWTVPQAKTGRLSGSGPNLQQISGDPKVLSCLVADEGYTLIERDWKSLEDYVAANVTQCKGLLALYGPDVTSNDGHLWLGSQLPVIGERIKATGYDKDNPTKETISKAKAECKKERDISKAVKYSATYGIGAFALWQDLISNGVDVTLEETAEILRGYWDVFSGMKQYKYKLKNEWSRNKGWIYNAIRRPVAVGPHDTKDLFSRAIQSGGHDLQMMFGMYVSEEVRAAGIDAKPYIYDLHDATYWQVRDAEIEDYMAVAKRAEERVWAFCKNELKWNCVLTTSAACGKTLKELKGY